MSRYLYMLVFSLILTSPAWPQSAPLYRITVVERTVKSVNYQYRNGPTEIDFRGTVLLPEAKGDATVESKSGRTEVAARFNHLPAPGRFGGEYLAYVLWAITPDGHPKNLGEIVPGSSDKAKTNVTTDLQAFGMIVTAEPYAAVRQPSDVVVMENEIRPDTIGTIEPVEARYELMPRHGYTYDKPANPGAAEDQGPKVSMNEYEIRLELYQAQNAVQIAHASDAGQYAGDLLNKAQAQLQKARTLHDQKADKSLVISAAREAAQTAEDARLIGDQRAKDAEIAKARSDAERERQLRASAEDDAKQARMEAQQAKTEAQAAVTQAEQAQAAANADRAQTEETRQDSLPQVPPTPVTTPAASSIISSTMPPAPDNRAPLELRAKLAQSLNGLFASQDTPRGLVASIPASDFREGQPAASVTARLAQLAVLVKAHPGLTVEVDGNCDSESADAERIAFERAEGVRDALVRAGLPSSFIQARAMGNSRPIGPNTSAQSREANRRTEIVISGAAIGNTAVWDRSYSILPKN